MRFSIKLRDDLARLNDAALVQRIDKAWHDYQAAERKPRRGELLGSWNGPIRHPWAYPWLSVLEIRKRGPFYRIGTPYGPPSWDPLVEMHLTLCEIRDLMDELERRVVRRRELHA